MRLEPEGLVIVSLVSLQAEVALQIATARFSILILATQLSLICLVWHFTDLGGALALLMSQAVGS